MSPSPGAPRHDFLLLREVTHFPEISSPKNFLHSKRYFQSNAS